MNAGTSAISTTMMLLKHEDHLIMVDDVYAGTQKYLRDIYGPRIGWSEGNGFDYCAICESVDNLKAALKPNTKMVWIEGQTNPILKVAHIEACAKAIKEHEAKVGHQIIFVVDNTFNSPMLVQPLSLGATISLYSCTKYHGGHANVIAGCVCLNDYSLFTKLKDFMES